MTYTVTWVNYNGQTLWEETNVPEGTIPSYQGVTPVKPEDDDYTYVYIGWSPEMSETYSDITYTAQFRADPKTHTTYTITWVNYDGTLLQEDEYPEESGKPFYVGLTPEKPEDDTYTYEFIGWSPEIVPVTEDATYTAVFEPHNKIQTRFTILWVNYDGTLLQKSEDLEAGQVPFYIGLTPEKPADENYTYEFIGWTPEIVPVTEDATYTATFGSQLIESTPYDLKPALPNKLLNSDGTITNMAGQSVTNPVDAYKNKPAIPNKFLNPDGTYSTLDEIIPGGGGGGSDLPIGTELDIDKNATIPSGWQEIEYDTGWVNISLDTTKCKEVSYTSGNNKDTKFTPQIRRIGNVVYLRGRIEIQKSDMSTTTAIPLVTSAFNNKFLTTECETNIKSVISDTGETVYNVYIGSRVRTDTNAGKMCIYFETSGWSSVPPKIRVQLDMSWAVDDLTTKRIKRIS